MGHDGGEKRSNPRAPIELRVEYKKVNAFLFDYTHNISHGGTFIKTNAPLPQGTEFLFKLVVCQLPEPLVLKGRVKWLVTENELDDAPSAREPGMGIEFIYDDQADRQRVERLVERLMVEQLGERVSAKLMRKA